MNVMNDYPTPEAPSPLLQLINNYRDSIVGWDPSYPHTRKVKRNRAKNKQAKISRRKNRGK